MLVSNHFKLTLNNKCLVQIYSIDWGTIGQDREAQRDALKSGHDKLIALLGIYVAYDSHIVCLQHADMELEIKVAAGGQQFLIALRHRISFSLDQQSPQMALYSPMVLQFLNVVVKNVLREA